MDENKILNPQSVAESTKKVENQEPGSINWKDFWKNEDLASPERRSVFPDGEDKNMSDDEVVESLNKYFENQKSNLFNMTGVDSEQFPEIIDKDIRDVCQKLNKLPFLKTRDGCSGHESYKTGEISNLGYSEPYLTFYAEEENPEFHKLKDQIGKNLQQFKESDLPGMENVVLNNRKEDWPIKTKGVGLYRYDMRIIPTKEWCKKNNKKYIPRPESPGSYPDWCQENGFEYSDDEEGNESETRQKWEEEKKKYREKAEQFGNEYGEYFRSNEARKLRDEFFKVFEYDNKKEIKGEQLSGWKEEEEKLKKADEIRINEIMEKLSAEQIRESIIKKAENLNIPILNEENIDEVLGDEPYFSHAIISDPAKLVKILETGEMRSSKESGVSAMTYEIDKLIGMDENVFFALGKGYMRKDNFSLVFNYEELAKMSGASFVEEDLMNMEGEIAEEFLEKHREEMMEIINQKRDLLKNIFEKRVTYAFQGGHGIYEKYFGEYGQDRIREFLDAIKAKGFHGISIEEEAIDQFTIERDAILGEEIMPVDLRKKLIKLLNEKVVEPHTVTGEKNIKKAVSQFWEKGKDSYRQFLSGDKNVPEKVTELRIANSVDLKKAIIGVYVPNIKE